MNKSTIKDIARIAGVSISTVSHALNESRYVKKETIERIKKIAEEYNYKPNYIARAMRTKYTKYIGFFIPVFNNPFYFELLEGINNVANELGYFIVLFSSKDEYSWGDKFFESILHRGIDGLLISGIEGHKKDRELIKRFMNANIPVVLLNRYFKDLKIKSNKDRFRSVVTDNYNGGKLAAEYLVKAGHKRIGFISSDLRIQIFKDRYNGFSDILKAENLREEFITEIPLPSYNKILDYFESNDKKIKNCTAIFAASDWIAIDLISYLSKHKIKVPEEISIIGFDNIQLSKFINPKLTTISQDAVRMGEISAKTLIKEINPDKADIRKKDKIILLPPTLVERDSVVRIDGRAL